jgi:hypothetical protein
MPRARRARFPTITSVSGRHPARRDAEQRQHSVTPARPLRDRGRLKPQTRHSFSLVHSNSFRGGPTNPNPSDRQELSDPVARLNRVLDDHRFDDLRTVYTEEAVVQKPARRRRRQRGEGRDRTRPAPEPLDRVAYIVDKHHFRSVGA